MSSLTDGSRPQVPPQALLLSLLSLWVPVLTSSLFPDWTNTDVGILVWLLALIPPFLLSYYKGWKGASLALAAGMAAFAVAQVLVTLIGANTPGPEIMLGILVVLIGVSMGSGVLSSLFHRSLDRAEEMALTDPGTGLPNRRHGMIHLTRAFAAAERGSKLSVVMFDLDKFKQVNDRFGHQKGDEVLQFFADILKRHTRTENLSVRFGGEEFVTILDGHGADGASIMAGRILEELREHEWPWGRTTVSA
ncbi:MAG: GGDEF domain-containing protein, partial [Longimicrobiales bacterium]|nr:GGDEF domain-containing protein [Longimicrobiales bacterium]